MNIKNYKKFLLKKGYVLDGPIGRTIIEPLEEFLEGNPVPSLDNKYIQALIKVKSAGNCRDLKAIKLVEKLIQNGVETNKEQPKKHCNTHWYVLMCDKCREEFDKTH